MTLPSKRDPIKEGYFTRGTPYDYLGASSSQCLTCNASKTHDTYKVILGMQGGVGLPFARKRSTTGKIGKRYQVAICTDCGTMKDM